MSPRKHCSLSLSLQLYSGRICVLQDSPILRAQSPNAGQRHQVSQHPLFQTGSFTLSYNLLLICSCSYRFAFSGQKQDSTVVFCRQCPSRSMFLRLIHASCIITVCHSFLLLKNTPLNGSTMTCHRLSCSGHWTLQLFLFFHSCKQKLL